MVFIIDIIKHLFNCIFCYSSSYYYYYYYYYYIHVIKSLLYRNKSNLKIIHKLSWVQYIIMHEYKLNCLVVGNGSCTQKLKLVTILFLVSPFLYCIVFSYVCVSAFVSSVQLYSYLLIL